MSSRAEKSASINTPSKTPNDSVILLRGKNDVVIINRTVAISSVSKA
jgi:hypothetical protein